MTTERGFASLMRSANHYHQKWKQVIVESNIKRNTVKVQDMTPTTHADRSPTGSHRQLTPSPIQRYISGQKKGGLNFLYRFRKSSETKSKSKENDYREFHGKTVVPFLSQPPGSRRASCREQFSNSAKIQPARSSPSGPNTPLSSDNPRKTYLRWIKRFILFHNKRQPAEMAEAALGFCSLYWHFGRVWRTRKNPLERREPSVQSRRRGEPRIRSTRRRNSDGSSEDKSRLTTKGVGL